MGEKAIYFSPTGGVKTVAEILCNYLIDFTLSGKELNFKSDRYIMVEFHRYSLRD